MVFIVGFLISFIGFIFAYTIVKIVPFKNEKFIGLMMAFSSGIIITYICFIMLPESIYNAGMIKSLIVLMAGVIFAFKFAKVLDSKNKTSCSKSSLLLVCAVIVHNIPEGIFLGSLLAEDWNKGISFAIFMVLHSLPESFTVMLPFANTKTKFSKAILYIAIISLPTLLGAGFGFYISGIFPLLINLALSFASGIMLYTLIAEVLPNCNEKCEAKYCAISVAVGLIATLIFVQIIYF